MHMTARIAESLPPEDLPARPDSMVPSRLLARRARQRSAGMVVAMEGCYAAAPLRSSPWRGQSGGATGASFRGRLTPQGAGQPTPEVDGSARDDAQNGSFARADPVGQGETPGRASGEPGSRVDWQLYGQRLHGGGELTTG